MVIDSQNKPAIVSALGEDNLSGLVAPFNLTKREVEVMALIVSGKTGKAIADELYVSESTIKKHTKSIYTKLQVENKVALLHKINLISQ